MTLVKIVQDFQAVEGWVVGEIVDMTNPDTLIREGKVILAKVEELVKNPKVDAAVTEAATVAEQLGGTINPALPNVVILPNEVPSVNQSGK